MPITPKYTWSQTTSTVEIKVQLQGLTTTKGDVFATSSLVKVNSSPYLLLLDLYKDVHYEKSTAVLVPEGVVFQLQKVELEEWPQLTASGKKDDIIKRRNDSIEAAYARIEQQRKARISRKNKEDKQATQRLLDLDRRKRQEVESRKKEELEEERRKIEEWRRGKSKDRRERGGDDEADGEASSDYESDEGDTEADKAAAKKGDDSGKKAAAAAASDHPDYYGRGWRKSQGKEGGSAVGSSALKGKEPRAGKKGGRKATEGGGEEEEEEEEGEMEAWRREEERRVEEAWAAFDSKSVDEAETSAILEEGEEEDEEDEEEEKRGGPGSSAPPGSFVPLPPPRLSLGPVPVQFTKLQTQHLPAREQREEEIKSFRKQQMLDKKLLEDSESLADRQPMFLKDKGDALYKKGDVRGAINAYSRGIDVAIGAAVSAAAAEVNWTDAVEVGAASAMPRSTEEAVTSLLNGSVVQDRRDGATGDAFLSSFSSLSSQQGREATGDGRLPSFLDPLDATTGDDDSEIALLSLLLHVQRPMKAAAAATGTAGRPRLYGSPLAEGALRLDACQKLLEAAKDCETKGEGVLWANRAAAHLRLGDLAAAAADAAVAIRMMNVSGQKKRILDDLRFAEVLSGQNSHRGSEAAPVAQPSAPIRALYVKALVRRAQALSDLGCLNAALQDYRLAIRMDPENALLRQGRDELEAALELANAADSGDDVDTTETGTIVPSSENSDTTAAAASVRRREARDLGVLRQRGDARFRSGDAEGALEAFDLVVRGLVRQIQILDVERKGLLSNAGASTSSFRNESEEEANADKTATARFKEEEADAGRERNVAMLQELVSERRSLRWELLAALSNGGACLLLGERYAACVRRCTRACRLLFLTTTSPQNVSSCFVFSSSSPLSSSSSTSPSAAIDGDKMRGEDTGSRLDLSAALRDTEATAALEGAALEAVLRRDDEPDDEATAEVMMTSGVRTCPGGNGKSGDDANSNRQAPNGSVAPSVAWSSSALAIWAQRHGLVCGGGSRGGEEEGDADEADGLVADRCRTASGAAVLVAASEPSVAEKEDLLKTLGSFWRLVSRRSSALGHLQKYLEAAADLELGMRSLLLSFRLRCSQKEAFDKEFMDSLVLQRDNAIYKAMDLDGVLAKLDRFEQRQAKAMEAELASESKRIRNCVRDIRKLREHGVANSKRAN